MHTCTSGKVRYADKAEATKASIKLQRRPKKTHKPQWNHGTIAVYQCRFCRDWHIGHQHPRVKP